MNTFFRLAIMITTLILLGAPMVSIAAPWGTSGFVHSKTFGDGKSLAIDLVVADEEGIPVAGLMRENFVISYLVATQGLGADRFLPADVLGGLHSFSEGPPGTYAMLIKVDASPETVSGVSVQVLKVVGKRIDKTHPAILPVPKASIFIPKVAVSN